VLKSGSPEARSLRSYFLTIDLSRGCGPLILETSGVVCLVRHSDDLKCAGAKSIESWSSKVQECWSDVA
jgi:hypothetical protein